MMNRVIKAVLYSLLVFVGAGSVVKQANAGLDRIWNPGKYRRRRNFRRFQHHAAHCTRCAERNLKNGLCYHEKYHWDGRPCYEAVHLCDKCKEKKASEEKSDKVKKVEKDISALKEKKKKKKKLFKKELAEANWFRKAKVKKAFAEKMAKYKKKSKKLKKALKAAK